MGQDGFMSYPWECYSYDYLNTYFTKIKLAFCPLDLNDNIGVRYLQRWQYCLYILFIRIDNIRTMEMNQSFNLSTI